MSHALPHKEEYEHADAIEPAAGRDVPRSGSVKTREANQSWQPQSSPPFLSRAISARVTPESQPGSFRQFCPARRRVGRERRRIHTARELKVMPPALPTGRMRGFRTRRFTFTRVISIRRRPAFEPRPLPLARLVGRLSRCRPEPLLSPATANINQTDPDARVLKLTDAMLTHYPALHGTRRIHASE